MLQKTALFSAHVTASAKRVDFAGWEMPLHYGSQLEEHHRVRREAGVFDVSHMLALDVEGEECGPFLQRVLANDIARLDTVGRALYSCLLNEQGGIIDDLIVYRLGQNFFRLILNAGSADNDLRHLTQEARPFSVTLTPRRDLAMLAIQGPQAVSRTEPLLPTAVGPVATLRPFHSRCTGDWMVARTGYTGEDGLEVLLPAAEALSFWDALLGQGIAPVGLGARDTLRLEAGLNLYGQDMDETTTPFVSNLGWTVAWEPQTRDFIGRTALTMQQQDVRAQLLGLILDARGVLRQGTEVITAAGVGQVTSGGFSPTLGVSIGLARVPAETGFGPAQVLLRGKELPARLVKPVFVRRGRILVDLPATSP